MRRVDLDPPLDRRKNYSIGKDRVTRHGLRYHRTIVYYKDSLVAEVDDTPDHDMQYMVCLTYSAHLTDFRLKECWNVIMRKLGVDASIDYWKPTEGARIGFKISILTGKPLNGGIETENWYPMWVGHQRFFHATRDKHVRNNPRCTCTQCLRKDTECQENSSSSTTALPRKRGRPSKSSPALSTTRLELISRR